MCGLLRFAIQQGLLVRATRLYRLLFLYISRFFVAISSPSAGSTEQIQLAFECLLAQCGIELSDLSDLLLACLEPFDHFDNGGILIL